MIHSQFLTSRCSKSRHATLKVEHLGAANLHVPVDKEHAGRDIGKWTGNALQKHMRAAVAKAGLPAAACAYSIRHGVISDMLSAGVNIFLIAKIAGTSVQMIERTYGHVYAADSVRALQTGERLEQLDR